LFDKNINVEIIVADCSLIVRYDIEIILMYYYLQCFPPHNQTKNLLQKVMSRTRYPFIPSLAEGAELPKRCIKDDPRYG